MIRVGVRVRAGDAEIALARLLDAFPAGVEERELPGAVEFGVYGDPEAVPALDGLIEIVSQPVADGWQTAYHAYLRRVQAGPFAVRPPWVAGGDDDLVIDPGTAFGAGSHPTTRLCLELLGNVGGGSLADWGAGTGVLAIAAARLGCSPVRAYELDETAPIEANAAANGVSLDVARLDLTRQAAAPATTVVANLTLPLLEAAARVQPRPRTLIASGILAHQADALAPAFGMAERERRVLEGWAAVVLE